MRLDAYLASFGIASRREAGEIIRAGRVLVEGAIQRDAARHIEPGRARVLYDSELLEWENAFYLMMNKAAGVLSATTDPRAATVLDALEPRHRARGVFPVGRLDRDVTGLLVLTDDGELAHRLLSPARKVDKVYEATLNAPLAGDAVAVFAKGIMLSDFTALPAQLELLSPTRARVTVHEGKFHQVKRMFEAVGSRVTSLKRLSMGNLLLDESLALGAWRRLSQDEIAQLKRAAGMS